MNDYLENIRRMAERGLGFANEEQHSGYVDMFQHILDEYERAKDKQATIDKLVEGLKSIVNEYDIATRMTGCRYDSRRPGVVIGKARDLINSVKEKSE